MERLLATGHRLPLVEGDGNTLIERRRADIVVVATPDCLHDGQVRLALEQGSHVMVEPLPTAGIDEWDLLVSEFRSRGRMLQVAAPWRMDPRFLSFKKQVSWRAPGSNRASIVCVAPKKDRMTSLLDGAGPVSDALFPVLDALNCVPANLSPAAVFAAGSPLRSPSFRLDAPQTMIGGILTHGGVDISIRYSEVDSRERCCSSSTLSLAGRGVGVVCQLEYRPRQIWLTSLWTDWLSSIRGEQPQAVPPENFRTAIALADGLLRAYASGRTLNFPVEPAAAPASNRVWAEHLLA